MSAFSQNMESELNSLNIDKNEKIPAAQSNEKLYSIQSRTMELKNRFEFLVGGGQNFTGDSFLLSRQMSVEGQYHFNNQWSLAATFSQMSNAWTSSTQSLIDQQGLVPDVDYIKSKTELRVQYNTLYGKMRWLRDSVSYFDQYVAFGYSANELSSGMSAGPVIDVGFAHWVSNWGSVHWGVKDYYYEENRKLTAGYSHNIFGYASVGYMFK
jgi:outer membrane beta-barrel protein